MARTKLVISMAVVLVLGIFIQVLLVFADHQDSPSRAAVAFTKAYYAFDKNGMAGRLCSASTVVDEVNVIDQYLHDGAQAAGARGFSLGLYTKNCLYHVETETLSKSFDTARVRLTAQRKSPLRTFFSKGDIHPVDTVYDLVREDGKWKICGSPSLLTGA